MNANTVTFFGKSKNPYVFELYPLGQEFNPLPGVYVVGRFIPAIGLSTPARIEALYVGETKSFVDRLNTGAMHHDGYKRALTLKATHIAVLICRDDAQRLSIETDLRHGLNPVCNAQSVPSNALMRTTLRF
jgi:hypothetical protein